MAKTRVVCGRDKGGSSFHFLYSCERIHISIRIRDYRARGTPVCLLPFTLYNHVNMRIKLFSPK